MALHIFLFGNPRFDQDGQPVNLHRRKAIALMAYLAVTGQPHGREALATLFWPEHDQSASKANLRRDLSRLRKALPDDVLQVDRTQVGIVPQSVIVDVADFQVKVALAQRHGHAPEDLCTDCVQALETAVSAYTGDFMAGFTLPDSPEFDDWQFFQREGYRQLFASVLQQLLNWYVSQAAWEQAISHGRRWLALDPLHEPAHRELMKLYAWSGQQAAALRQYQECERLMWEEIGVEPEPETIDLYEQIRTRQLAQAAVQHVSEAAGSQAAKPVAPTGPERFVQEGLLATGGHGALYKGRDLLTDQPVVIKTLRPEFITEDSEFVTRFLREGEALRQLNHPNIVRMLGMFEVNGRQQIIMEYVSGGSLRDLIEKEGPLSYKRTLAIALELADALSRAHHLGIIHRDIKPDNVLLAQDGTPRLTDFGVALLEREDGRLTPAGSFIGSPTYMSPEVIRGGTPDARSDVWSFGAMLFEMLAGRPPFEGDRITSILVNIMGEPLPDITQTRPDINLALEGLLHQMLAKDPEKRLPSMRQAAAELEAIRDGRVSVITATPIAVPVMKTPIPVEQRIDYCLTENNVRLAYATAGSGPPLVKAANWLSHLEYDWQSPVWRHWLSYFTAEHTLIRYDERGCGLSDWNVDDFTFEAWLRDLETVVDAVGFDRFPLLGMSQGGPIAIAYALRHPERVSRLILYGTYARGKYHRNESAEKIEELETLLQLVRLGWGKETPAFRQVFTSLFMPDGSKEQFEMFNELQRVSSTPENAARIIESFCDINVTAEAQQLQVPTLVLHATDDARIPFEEGKLVASLIPEAHFVPLQSKNHILLEDEPAWQIFKTEVTRFIKPDRDTHRVWSTPSPLQTAVTPGEQQIQYTLSFDNTRIAYATVGAGPPLVKTANYLSHLEYDWNSPIWGHVLQGIAQNHTFIRYDERGTGLSQWEIEDFTFEAWVKDLEAVVDAAGLDRFALMGISQGGAVAIAYAARHPERVTHLIISGGYAQGWLNRDLTPEQEEERQLMLQLMKLGWGRNNPAFGRAITSQLFPECTAEQMRWLDELQKVSATAENAVRLENEMHQVNVRHLLSAVQTPTLILHSRHDASVPFAEGQLLAAEIPQAQIIPIDTKNHLILEQEPTWPAYLAAINNFLDEGTTAVPPASVKALIPTPNRPLYTLPAESTPLFGREAELAQIRTSLTDAGCRLLTIVGLGGMGKSRLALEGARQLVPAFKDGVVFVPLAGVSNVTGVPAAMAAALQVTLSGREEPLQQLLNGLGQKEMLLVLDNVEQLLGDDQPVDGTLEINRMLDHCPNLKLLVTSREPLQLVAEWRLVLEGLPIPARGENEVEAYPSVRLFVQTAVQSQADFALSTDNAATIGHICRLAAGMPLAIKLAATWIRAIPLERIEVEMEQSLGILATRLRDVPERQRSMRVVFDYSWDLLTEVEKEVFQALSVFRGGFSEEAAQLVANASPFMLAGLVDRGLVHVAETAIPMRYTMHELTRQYAAERLAKSAAHPTILKEHARYFAEFVQQRNEPLRNGGFATAVSEIETELNNINAATRWLLQQVTEADQRDFAIELLLKLPAGMQFYFYLNTALQTANRSFLNGVQVFEAEGFDRLPADHPGQRLLAQCRTRAAFFSFGVGEYETVDRLLRDTIPWLRQQDDEEELALALSVLGKTMLLRGQRPQAQELLLESLDLSRRTQDQYGEADALKVLGVVAVDSGDYDQALAYYHEALAIFESCQFKPGITMISHNIGTALFRQEKFEEAQESYERAYTVAQEINYQRMVMESGGAIGGMNRVLGRYDRAEKFYRMAIQMSQEMGELRHVAINRRGLGMNYLQTNDLAAAEKLLQEGIAVGWQIENAPEVLAGLSTLAQTWARQGRLEEALKLGIFVSQQEEGRAKDREENDQFLAELIQELRPSVVSQAARWASGQTLAEVVSLVLSDQNKFQ